MWVLPLVMVGLVIAAYLIVRDPGPDGLPLPETEPPPEAEPGRAAEPAVGADAYAEVLIDQHGELVEVQLVACRMAGILSAARYRQEMALVAMRDMDRQPLVVPEWDG